MALPLFARGSIKPADDLITASLNLVNFRHEDLGYKPKGYWRRYPLEAPYKLRFFDDLFAEPLRMYDYTRQMGNACETFCDPKFLGEDNKAIYYLAYNLCIEPKIQSFRNYDANLYPYEEYELSTLTALETLFNAGGAEMEYMSFGKIGGWPNSKEEVIDKLIKLPPALDKIFAKLIYNLADSYQWQEKALRRCNPDALQSVFDTRDLGATQGDGMIYYPAVDDVAQTIDEQCLYYCGLKCAHAVGIARLELEKFLGEVTTATLDLEDIDFNILSPIGRVVIGGTRDDKYNYDDACLIVDLGGNDRYEGPVGASMSLKYPIGLCIDMSGNDGYISEHPGDAAQGSGVLGCGILVDNAGNDVYRSTVHAQGCGYFGLGILFDKEGNDDYRCESSGQGCGLFGCGLLADVVGDDTYYLYGDGQGYGGVGGGIGVLCEYDGNDIYTAEPLTSVFNRGDYHSANKINVSQAQGAGAGRRGDGSDGHAWAGGIGAILDIHGNDKYISGNWSLGCGYWYGAGFAYDKWGDDVYQSVYFTHASGAHYAMGCLIDEHGNDVHELSETSGAGLSFGWDFVNTLLVDKEGNDIYKAKIISIACAQIRSNSFLFDLGGNDYYALGKGQQGMGAGTFLEDYRTPHPMCPFSYYAKSIGLFIDVGGEDTYEEWDTSADPPTFAASAKYINDSIWYMPEKGSDIWGYDNYGIGIDIAQGDIKEFHLYDKWDKDRLEKEKEAEKQKQG